MIDRNRGLCGLVLRKAKSVRVSALSTSRGPRPFLLLPFLLLLAGRSFGLLLFGHTPRCVHHSDVVFFSSRIRQAGGGTVYYTCSRLPLPTRGNGPGDEVFVVGLVNVVAVGRGVRAGGLRESREGPPIPTGDRRHLVLP